MELVMGSAGAQTQVNVTPYPDEALSLSNKKISLDQSFSNFNVHANH